LPWEKAWKRLEYRFSPYFNPAGNTIQGDQQGLKQLVITPGKTEFWSIRPVLAD